MSSLETVPAPKQITNGVSPRKPLCLLDQLILVLAADGESGIYTGIAAIEERFCSPDDFVGCALIRTHIHDLVARGLLKINSPLRLLSGLVLTTDAGFSALVASMAGSPLADAITEVVPDRGFQAIKPAPGGESFVGNEFGPAGTDRLPPRAAPAPAPGQVLDVHA